MLVHGSKSPLKLTWKLKIIQLKRFKSSEPSTSMTLGFQKKRHTKNRMMICVTKKKHVRNKMVPIICDVIGTHFESFIHHHPSFVHHHPSSSLIIHHSVSSCFILSLFILSFFILFFCLLVFVHPSLSLILLSKKYGPLARSSIEKQRVQRQVPSRHLSAIEADHSHHSCKVR